MTPADQIIQGVSKKPEWDLKKNRNTFAHSLARSRFRKDSETKYLYY